MLWRDDEQIHQEGVMNIAYIFQAFIVLLWWIGIIVIDDFYKVFEYTSLSKKIFLCFMAPDVIVIAILSLIKSYTKIKNIEYVILGGFLYATLFCFAVSVTSGDGRISTLAMTLGLCFNSFLCFSKYTLRSAKLNSVAINYAKTIVLIICTWGIFLGVLPCFILLVLNGNVRLDLPSPHGVVACVMFLMASCIGLASAHTMVRLGNGTPLPFDATNKLVVAGPYKYIRNPMAFSGFIQGVSVALLFLSVGVLVYFIVGILCWECVIRKYEEKDLLEKYGQEYITYTSKVKCWVPTFGRNEK